MSIKSKFDFPAFIAEFIATFLIVFLSCYSDICDEGKPSQNGICVLMLYAFFTYAMAPISGSHFNPAITFALMIEQKFEKIKGIIYISCQLVGSL